MAAYSTEVLHGSSLKNAYHGRVELASLSTLLMRNIVMQHHYSTFGGAVEAVDATLFVYSCLFRYNVAENLYVLPGAGHGGAIYVHGGGQLHVTDTEFWNNAGQVGGAVAAIDAQASFTGCTFGMNTIFRRGELVGGATLVTNLHCLPSCASLPCTAFPRMLSLPCTA